MTQVTATELGGGCGRRVPTEEPAESQGCVCTPQGGGHLFCCPESTPQGAAWRTAQGWEGHGPAWGYESRVLRRGAAYTPAEGEGRGACLRQGAADGGAAAQTKREWEARKVKLRRRERGGCRDRKGRGRPCTAPSPQEEKAEWEEAATGNPQGWKYGFQGNVPRNGPDVTAGRAPFPPPSARQEAQTPPTLGDASLVAAPLAPLHASIAARG